jgi:hypothetical protein
VSLEGFAVIADKGFAGRDFEAFMAERGATFLRPDRKDASMSVVLPAGQRSITDVRHSRA